MTIDREIAYNIKAHDKVAKQYDAIHFEIFSNEEQKRIKRVLSFARSQTKANTPKALDLGCGSGNLTNHLLELGYATTSADISTEFIKIVSQRYKDSPLHSTLQINGEDLRKIPNNSFDLVGTYSVLHHIPDYMGMIDEMLRILKPSGLIYLDHEAAPHYWDQTEEYKAFKKVTKWKLRKANYKTYLRPRTYLTFLRQLRDPKYRPEGDIHVFKDDHIEWSKIRTKLESKGVTIIKEEDYLLHKIGHPKDIYNAYKNQCTDYRFLIGAKNHTP